MKLKLTYINEDTSEVFILKNKHNEVFYHSSEEHDPGEYEKLSGKALRVKENKRNIISIFYKLAGDLS